MAINIEKMKFDSTLKLPEHVFDAYARNTCDYFANLVQSANKVSPTYAVDIVSALSEFKEYFQSESE